MRPRHTRPAAIAARTYRRDVQALARVVPVVLALSASISAQVTVDHPVYARSTCPTRLWQPSEVPQIHEIDVSINPTDFRFMIDHQAAQYDDPNARDMNLTSITFDGEVRATRQHGSC